jgi:hypothetical protein
VFWIRFLIGLRGVAVAMDKMENKHYYCSKHDVMSCPLCGSMLVKVNYVGNKPEILALTKHDGFRGLWGCLRVDLHDKIVDGVDYRDKVFIKPIFDKRE